MAKVGSSTLSDVFSPSVFKDGIQRAFIAPPAVNTDKNIQLAASQAIDNRPGHASDYYPTASYAGYTPRALDDHQYAKNFFPAVVSKLLSLSAY